MVNDILIKVNSLCYELKSKIYEYYVMFQCFHLKNINHSILIYYTIIQDFRILNRFRKRFYSILNPNQINNETNIVSSNVDYNSDASDISYEIHDYNEIFE